MPGRDEPELSIGNAAKDKSLNFSGGFGKGHSEKHTTIDAGLANLSTEEVSILWGISATGRAPALHAGGYRFKSDMFHHKPGLYSIGG